MSTLANIDKAILMARIRLELLRAERAAVTGDGRAALSSNKRLYVLECRRQSIELEAAEAMALEGGE